MQLTINNQKKFFESGKTLSISARINALKRLKMGLIKNEEVLLKALNEDLGKSKAEAYLSEMGMVLSELSFAIKNTKHWVKPKRKRTSLAQFPAKGFELTNPYGVVLIISPWNYPLMLTLCPLIGAIAAGNCAVLKPSDLSPHTSSAIKQIIEGLFPKNYIAVIEGGIAENTQLLEQKFDYIFFTGGATAGRVVLEKAAVNLTPVTLELGGKSPCIVDKTANIKLAAKRIAFGKLMNSGQTCVAPDYILIEQSVKDKFITELKYYITKMVGDSPLKNSEYPHMINQNHFDRIVGLIENDKIVFGGKSDKESLKIEPTILDNVIGDEPIMKEEIFGPILPLIEFSQIEQAIQFIEQRESPLALYLFTQDKKLATYILNKLAFGGGCVNDTILHMISPYMGFGGVGASGTGRYHGKYTFDTFSHKKSIIIQSTKFDIPFRYPPYSAKSEQIIRKILK